MPRKKKEPAPLIILVDHNQFERLRAMLTQEGVKDFTLLSDKAQSVLGDANWKVVQKAKKAGRFVTVQVKRLENIGRISA